MSELSFEVSRFERPRRYLIESHPDIDVRDIVDRAPRELEGDELARHVHHNHVAHALDVAGVDPDVAVRADVFDG